ncbi:hypothetical protein J3F84DRAFT_378143 [Trichoderma pleuroticola]
MMRCFCCSWRHLFLSHVVMPTCIIGPVDPCIALCGKQHNLSDALDWEFKKKKARPLALPYNERTMDHHRLIRVLLNCAQKSYSATATLCNSLIGYLVRVPYYMTSQEICTPEAARARTCPCCATLAEARSSGCHSSTQDTCHPGLESRMMRPACQAMPAEIFLHPFFCHDSAPDTVHLQFGHPRDDQSSRPPLKPPTRINLNLSLSGDNVDNLGTCNQYMP